MLYCLACGGYLSYAGVEYEESRGVGELLECSLCHEQYHVDDITELDAVEQALVEDAIHGEKVINYEDETPHSYIPRWEDYGSAYD